MENKCVICGAEVPECRQVCLICEYNIMEGKKCVRTLKRTKDEVSTEE